jgi:tricorn protease-like protein
LGCLWELAIQSISSLGSTGNIGLKTGKTNWYSLNRRGVSEIKTIGRNSQRTFLIGVAVLVAVTLSLAIVAVIQLGAVTQEENRANNARFTAIAEASTAQANLTVATNAKDAALNQAATVNVQASIAATAKAEAANQMQVAQTNFAKSLASQSLYYANNKQLELGLLLSIEAIKVAKLPETKASLPFGLASNPDISLITYLQKHSAAVRSVTFNPRGETVASGSWDKIIFLWDSASGKYRDYLKDSSFPVLSVAYSPNGQLLAGGSSDGSIILWEVESDRPLKTFKGHNDAAVFSVAFSPDGKILASASADSNVILWEVESGKQLNILKGHSNTVFSVAFSPDGKILASGSADNTIILWEVESGKQLNILKGHTEAVFSVAFSPDGKMLASGSADNTIILWEVESGKQLNILKGHSNVVFSVVFSPDGKMLASGSADNNVILWDLDLQTWENKACKKANRNLSRSESLLFFGDSTHIQTCPELPPGQQK